MPNYNPTPTDIDIKSSAKEMRTFTLAFIAFLLAVLTIASTTDILSEKTVKLPVVDIDINNIIQFDIFSAILILILHLHLLLQYFLFSRQYYSFDKALIDKYPVRADRIRYMKDFSSTMSLVHLLGGYQKSLEQLLLAGIVASYLFIFPIFNLWFLQAELLPLHDNGGTNIQCMTVFLDFLMSLAFLAMILDKNDTIFWWWGAVISKPIVWIYQICCWLLKQLLLLFPRPRFAGFHSFTTHISSRLTSAINYLQRRYPVEFNHLQRFYIALSIRSISVRCFLAVVLLVSTLFFILFLSVYVSTVPQKKDIEKKTDIDYFIKDFIYDRETWVLGSHNLPNCQEVNKNRCNFKVDKNSCNVVDRNSLIDSLTNFCTINLSDDDPRDILLLTVYLHEKGYTGLGKKTKSTKQTNNEQYYSGSEPFLFRNLDFSKENTLSTDGKSEKIDKVDNTDGKSEKVVKIDLNGRDLRYANLKEVKFSNAELNGADLQGADLTNADLTGAKLQGADLRNADLTGAKLQGADLYSAKLQDAYLTYAQLQGADLYAANLQDAGFEYAQLQGADLYLAQLKNADFEYAQLQGADLRNTLSKDVDLKNTQLKGAYLTTYVDDKTEKFSIATELPKKPALCLKDDNEDYAISICDSEDDKQALKKITDYWVNDLACSNQWIAQGIIRNYLEDDGDLEEANDIFKSDLIRLLSQKLKDANCLGIQNLPDNIKSQIQLLASVIVIPDVLPPPPPPPLPKQFQPSAPLTHKPSKPVPSNNWKIEKNDKLPLGVSK